MRLLIVRACAVGDFILNLPALRALAAAHPDARFTLVGNPAVLALARSFLPIDQIHSLEQQPWAGLFVEPQRDLHFDAAWVWMKDSAVADNLRLSGIAVVHHHAAFPSSGHAADHLLDTVGLHSPSLPDLWIPCERVLLHPGSGGRHKIWPGFETLGEALPDAVVIRGPAEEPWTGDHAHIESRSLPEVAEEIRRCRVFIGNDSGITHLAAYWGAPTIALFGPTDPSVWGPVGRRVTILKKPVLSDISVDEILKLL